MDITFTRKFGHQEQEKSGLWTKNLVIHKTGMQSTVNHPTSVLGGNFKMFGDLDFSIVPDCTWVVSCPDPSSEKQKEGLVF